MNKIYEYDSRFVIEFSNKNRVSYSKKRYGKLIDSLVEQSIKEEKKIFNPIKINKNNNTIEIYYYLKSKDKIKTIIVDFEDYYKYELWNYYWQCTENNSGTDYPFCTLDYGKLTLKLHHIISKISEEQIKKRLVVDHINNNKLNNKKDNLRIVTNRQNSTNQINQINKGVGRTRDKRGYRARWSYMGEDFEKNFYGENSHEMAKQYRLEMMKKYNYLCIEK